MYMFMIMIIKPPFIFVTPPIDSYPFSGAASATKIFPSEETAPATGTAFAFALA